eukprot:scpid42110/ scgid7444/ 
MQRGRKRKDGNVLVSRYELGKCCLRYISGCFLVAAGAKDDAVLTSASGSIGLSSPHAQSQDCRYVSRIRVRARSCTALDIRDDIGEQISVNWVTTTHYRLYLSVWAARFSLIKKLPLSSKCRLSALVPDDEP